MRHGVLSHLFFSVILLPVLPLISPAQTSPDHVKVIASANLPPGMIVGTITDPAGAGIPRADVQALQFTGAHFEAITDSTGRYRLDNVPAGNYCMSAVARGFSDSVVDSAVHVSNFEASTLDMSLAIGQCTSACVVTGDMAPPSNLGLALGLRPDRELVSADSGLRVTATLVNTTQKPLDVKDGLDPNSGYVAQAYAPCGCLGRLPADTAPTRTVRIPPGGKLTHSIDLSTLIAKLPRGTYRIYVQHAAAANSATGSDPSLVGASVGVNVVSSELAASCK